MGMMFRKIGCALFGHTPNLWGIRNTTYLSCHCSRCGFQWMKERTEGL